jgi:hypothetical protein
MPSPFPGMDPYLEPSWANVHVLMIGAIAASLKRVLPAGLQARPEEEIRVEELAGEHLAGYRPDVALVDASRYDASAPSRPSATAVAEPIKLAYHVGPIKLRHVSIVDARDGNRVVTAIEVLSPWNKLSGTLNIDYVKKLRAYQQAGANWVEVDLLRSPRDRLIVRWDSLGPEQRGTYLTTVFDAQRHELLAYPIGLRERLPVIAIPLREGDAAVPLDLQVVLDRVRDDGPFDELDYAEPLDPPLSDDDQAWLRERLAQARGASA